MAEENFLLTKIVATLGPATSEPEIIEKLILEGVRVFRINFSHGTFDEHEAHLNRVRQASKKLNIPIGVLGDLAGPKIRVGNVQEDGVRLAAEDIVEFQKEDIFTESPHENEPVVFSTTYPHFIEEVQPGERVLLDDGYVRLICIDKANDRVRCKVVDGGLITSNKGVNLPDTDMSVPALTEKDVECAEFAVDKGFDFLALSFVRRGEDIKRLKDKLRKLGARPSSEFPFRDNDLEFSAIEVESESIIPVICKIEKPQAIDNLTEILRESDAVMVARGDLGVEMDLAEVAVFQKRIINLCQEYGIPVIVATQMLQSMIDSPTPTRAEVSDVANAIFDGADAVMLSGETAIGKYPVRTVRMMNRIAQKTNAFLKSEPVLRAMPPKITAVHRRVAAIAHSIRSIVQDMDVKYLVIWSQLGGGAVYLSQQRILRPILFFSPSETMLRRTSLLYGIKPMTMSQPESVTDFLKSVDALLLENKWAERSDTIVGLLAEPIHKMGIANEIVIHYVGDVS